MKVSDQKLSPRINAVEEDFYEKSYCKVNINTEDDLPLNKSL